MKDVDLGEPTSFFDHVCWGCIHREMSNKQRSCGQSQKHVWIQNLRWSYRKATFFWETWRKLFLMVLWCGRSCKEMRGKIIANLRQKRLNNKTKSQHHALNDHQSKEKYMGSVGDLSTVCSQIILKCVYLARFGRPDILWYVNILVRAVTKWTRACGKSLARWISCIHHTSDHRQYCHVWNSAQRCRLGLFQDSDFAGDLEDSKSTSGGILCIFGSHTFVPRRWMCKKQTSASHSSTESANYFSWCRSSHGWNPSTWSLGFVYRSVSFYNNPIQQHQRSSTKKLVA